VTYRRRASPLHAARAGVGATFCLVLATVTLGFEHPVVLLALLAALLGAAAAAGVWGPVAHMVMRFGIPFGVLIALVNALVVRTGATVLVRGWSVPVLGQLDVTLEATAYGAILGLRALIIFGCGALLSAAIDPDELLRAFRRLGFRSALTASLATRLLPVLARDARRMRDAQRARGGEPAPPLLLLRAVTTGALDRAVDVAATLEVRGYGGAGRPARTRRPWSRHDAGFALAALALAGLGGAAVAGGWSGFGAYPRLEAPVGPAQLGLAAALAACVLLPFADRRGIER
jgi:energy-coupling factor transport system permease protein